MSASVFSRRLIFRPTPFHLGLIVVATCLAFWAVPVRGAPETRALIEGGRRVGSFEIGKPWGPYGKALGQPTQTRQSENSTTAKMLYYKKYGLFFLVKKDTVNGISVASPLFVTSDGLHVGSTRADVLKKYGAPQSLRQEEVVYPEHGIGFTYAGERVIRVYVFDKEARDLVKGDRLIVLGQRVGGMRLGDAATFVTRGWKEPQSRADFPGKSGAQTWAYTDKGVTLVVFQGRIDGVWLFTPEFRTAKDIHVGSRREAVIQAYGKPTDRKEGLESYRKSGLIVFYENGVVREIYVKMPD